MGGERRITAFLILILLVVFVGFFPSFVRCQEDDYDDIDGVDPAKKGDLAKRGDLSSFLTSAVRVNFRKSLLKYSEKIQRNLSDCSKNVTTDFDEAFNFEGRDDFIKNCQKQLQDLPKRLCTAAELNVYFSSFLEKARDSSKTASQTVFLKPTKNCNLSSWSAGCEPGWASTAGPNQKVNLSEADPNKMPYRTTNSKPCCEGFFCPQGLTCMIPCPLGAYCPVAKLSEVTGICNPYHYQQPAGKRNHTCGAADMWGPVQLGNEVFCKPGWYCPSTTQKIMCPKGYYCRRGSTHKVPCFARMCDAETEIPSMKVFGIMLIGLLSGILLVVYSCSDQFISNRYEKLAKSREAAAKYARETAQARERWKAVKPSALQQITRTFSRTASSKTDPKAKGSNLPPAPGAKPGNLTKMLHSLDDNSDSHEGFNVEIGDKNIKKQVPKTKKDLHTKSQIYKYAYGQIEKEKAMEEKTKNMTFSGVISMAKEGDAEEVRKRPRIEVAFKELTLTLKGKNKHIMRSVSGKIFPGRISAVMGPSGAGKTTFLSALTGKITGCTMSGQILINGKNESIHSYKKIIGFVPQDDIVHGDLTVEENLRFSARCRLPDELPKADKVLIIERVIEALGLQGVRESIVGTVEKRGISGGQKKRVNVGLEMVMEPSLLILDEPTSGLDSSSSSLLLRALRRESLEGVNISMVVHQPSYSLYKMFDDLILLAKGGLTVYHGPVKKVEEYFAGLGITVPERVNTPDHLIDILEGITKPGGNVTAAQLPVRWMLHNSYRVPPDMLHLCEQGGSGTAETTSSTSDLWQDLSQNSESRSDVLEYSVLRTPDLSGRVTPGLIRQYRYYIGRVFKQRTREARVLASDYLILLLAGACLGTMAKVNDETFGATGYQYTVIAVSLLCMIGALRTFSQDKLQYKRECSSGMNSLSYFLAKDTMDHLNTIMKPLVYLCLFYFFNYPRSSFGSNYSVLICLVYCVTGIAYILAISLEFSQAQLMSVLLPVVLTLIATQEKTSVASFITPYVFPRWALEAFLIANAEEYSGVWLMTRCAALRQYDFKITNSTRCLCYLLGTGVGARVVAFICLIAVKK